MEQVPATFGKYFLTAKVATGGMAEIYLAKLIGPGGFEKHLIIKQIHPQYSTTPQFVDLFVAEAKTLVSLSHGNIVPIYELGVVDDTYFIAMEYIDGPTLDNLLRALRKRKAQLSPAMAAYIAAEILKGLDYAHRKGDGVVHRDLSPRNVMISREGEVKLVDFGLAVAVDSGAQRSGAGGRPAGSFPYMSPEQVRGESLDARSDLFSAGVLLWEMLTGKYLFAHKDADETLRAVEHADIATPSAVKDGLPPELDEVCRVALSRDKDERYQTAADFLSKLGKFVYAGAKPVTPAAVSELLARVCPPTTAEMVAVRAVTESERSADRRAGTAGGKHLGHTVPMARGKHRAETVQTFATNAAFEEELLGDSEPKDQPLPAGTVPMMRDDEPAVVVPKPAPVEPAAAEAVVATEPPPPARKLQPALFALPVVAIAVAVLVITKPWSSSEDSFTPADAAVAVATPDAAGMPAPDAAPPDARRPDAAPPPDAVRRPKPKADARVAPVVGKAELTVGANPWADVYVDGKKVGRAPGTFKLTAGKHRVKAVFKGQERSWSIDLPTGGAKRLFHDFKATPAP